MPNEKQTANHYQNMNSSSGDIEKRIKDVIAKSQALRE